MTTASDMIGDALRELQALDMQETPSAAMANFALRTFNRLLDSWTAGEELMAYEIEENSFTLQIGKASYTIGSGGDIADTRPTDIAQAYIQDTNNNNYLLRLVPRDKWNEIGNRGPLITSQIPNTLFYDPQYPLGVINIFPTPLLPYSCFYSNNLQQVTFAALTTALSMPPGYEYAFVLSLAVALSSAMGIPIPPATPGNKSLTERAEDAKANVKRGNLPEILANYDGAIVSNSYATYNVYSDSMGGRRE